MGSTLLKSLIQLVCSTDFCPHRQVVESEVHATPYIYVSVWLILPLVISSGDKTMSGNNVAVCFHVYVGCRRIFTNIFMTLVRMYMLNVRM